jgi:hypothetical protein
MRRDDANGELLAARLGTLLRQEAELPLGVRARVEARVLASIREAEPLGWDTRVAAACALLIGLRPGPAPVVLVAAVVLALGIGVLYARLLDWEGERDESGSGR